MRTDPIRWLYGELPGLVKRGILTADAADSLRGHYGPLPETNSRRVLLMVFGTLGALLIGSGIVLLLAHNWEELSRPVRAGISFGLLLVAQAIALWVARRRADSGAWSEGSASFLSLAVVACIALISQTYNLGGDLQRTLISWVALTLPVAYLLRSRIVTVMCWVGATWWLMLAPWAEPTIVPYAYYLGFVLLALPLFAWLHFAHRYEPRSALVGWVICGSLAVALIRLGAWPEIGLWAPLYAGLLGSIYAFGYWRSSSSGQGVAAWRRPFHIFGALGLGVLLVVRSFDDLWQLEWNWTAADNGYAPLVISIGLAALLSVLAGTSGVRLLMRGKIDQGLLACTPLLIAPCWLAGFDHSYSTAIMLAVNLYALGVGLTVCVRNARLGQLGTANAGLLLVLAILTVRFFDADLSFVARGVGFIVLGVALLATNLWMLRRRGEVTS